MVENTKERGGGEMGGGFCSKFSPSKGLVSTLFCFIEHFNYDLTLVTNIASAS